MFRRAEAAIVRIEGVVLSDSPVVASFVPPPPQESFGSFVFVLSEGTCVPHARRAAVATVVPVEARRFVPVRHRVVCLERKPVMCGKAAGIGGRNVF